MARVAGRERVHSESPSTSEPVANDSTRMHEEVVEARGHDHVTAAHDSTFEVTSDDYLTPAGDCILGIEADRVPADFDDAFVAACQEASASITAEFEVTEVADGHTETVTIEGRGDPALTFDSERSLVGRTSDYVDDRTVMVGADRAAGDLPRAVVSSLADGAALTLRLQVR